MSTIGLVPARCGSKSIPFKNIKNFCQKPLVYWTLSALQQCGQVDVVYLATDCEEIASAVRSFELDKVQIYHRSPANASDTASTESVLLEFLEAHPEFGEEDTVVLVQATSPLLESQHLEEALAKYRAECYDSIVSCVHTKRFFWNKGGTPVNYDYRNRPRRQDFEGWWMENGAFYIQSAGGIREHQNRLGGRIGIYEMPEHTSVELDEPVDWTIAESLMHTYVLKPQSSPVRLFLTDVDGVLTDSGMYYTQSGDEYKKFNTRDGMGFELLRKAGIRTGIITSENTEIVTRRATKIKADYLHQGQRDGGKLAAALEICEKEGISLHEVAYIGDDINCIELLKRVGFAACPADAVAQVKALPTIHILSTKGGQGCVRELVEMLLPLQ